MKAAVPPARLVKPGHRNIAWGSGVPLRARVRDRVGAAGARVGDIGSALARYMVLLAPLLATLGLMIGLLWAMSFQAAP